MASRSIQFRALTVLFQYYVLLPLDAWFQYSNAEVKNTQPRCRRGRAPQLHPNTAIHSSHSALTKPPTSLFLLSDFYAVKKAPFITSDVSKNSAASDLLISYIYFSWPIHLSLQSTSRTCLPSAPHCTFLSLAGDYLTAFYDSYKH